VFGVSLYEAESAKEDFEMIPQRVSPRVGYILKRYPRYSETFIVNEILAHERAGLEIEIFSLRPPNDSNFQNAISRVRAPVTYLPSDGVKAVNFWQAIEEAGTLIPEIFARLEAARGEDPVEIFQSVVVATVARSRGLTHLHAHFATSAATVARLAAHFAQLPYSFTAHAKDIFHESVSVDDLRRKLQDAAAVVTVSDFNLRFLQDKYRAAAARVERIYNGLHLAEFRFQVPSARRPKIVAVGRLVEKKGFHYLIEACSMLKEQAITFSCAIVGVGPLETELRVQIENLGLSSEIQMLGPRPQSEVIELVQDASVFAAPCVIGSDGNRDGLPTVLLEAMALGTPCISTDVTGIPEILHHRATGLVVPQRNANALATALKHLLIDRDLAVSLAVAARKLVEKQFDIDANTASLRELFATQPQTLALQEVA
jgi:glycosyltransferase involved in cell wall biosynthesis